MVAIEVKPGLFGPPLVLGNMRMGDLLAACNFLEYLREQANIPDLKMYFRPDVLFPSDHVKKFHDFLSKTTDYITDETTNLIPLNVRPGTDPTYPSMYNIWNIRKDVAVKRQDVFHIEDKVRIPNTADLKDKIVICPLMDAPYNAYRNWPLSLVQTLVDNFSEYTYEESIIISKEPIDGLDLKRFVYSHDFDDNLLHVMECIDYYGGETGFSKFASALDPTIPLLNYYYSKETYGTTFPFHWKKKGRIVFYDGDYPHLSKEEEAGKRP